LVQPSVKFARGTKVQWPSFCSTPRMYWRHWLSLVLLNHKSQWGLVRNGPKRPQPCQPAPFLLTPPSNFAIPELWMPLEATKGTSAPKYEMRRRGFVCLTFEGLMWKYAIRGGMTATSRTLNCKNMSNDHEIPHGIFKPTGKCGSRWEIYFRGVLHDGRLHKMLVLSKRPTRAKPELRPISDLRWYA
jgi:hypothetical protein